MSFLKGFKRVFLHPLNQGRPLQTLGRVMWWKYNQLFLNYPAIAPYMGQTKIICYPDSSFSGLVIYTRIPEYEESCFIHAFLKPGDVVFDVGAQHGDFALLAVDKGITSIYAFEPTPTSITHLKDNVILNHASSMITIVPQAVSNSNGESSFTLTTHSEVNSLTPQASTTKTSAITVPTITLDSFVKKEKLSNITFLKIDIEGAEMLALQGAQRLLSQHQIEILFIEVNKNSHQYGFSFADLRAYLQSYGYRLFTITDKLKLEPLAADWEPVGTPNIVAVSPTSKRVKKYYQR